MKLTEYYQNLSEADKQNWESKYDDRMNEALGAIGGCGSNADCKEKLTEAGYGDILLPEWATINLLTTGDSSAGYGYWTSTPAKYSVVSSPDFAWVVNVFGYLYSDNVDSSGDVGVRPVIHIYESNILSKLDAPEYVNPDDVGGEIV